MESKTSVIILAAAIALAAASGVTFALVKPTAKPIAALPTTAPPVANQSAPDAIAQENASPAAEHRRPTPSQPKLQQPRTTSANHRIVESCKVTMARVNDPESPLNVRSAPTISASNVVGQLQNGTYVEVMAEQNDWLQIATPVDGWIARNRTEVGCNEKVERVYFGQGQTTAALSDRFIGSGSHRYLLNASKGQQITLTRSTGPLPTVIAPDGNPLSAADSDENRAQWTGVLVIAGDYTILLDSNFRGYKYSFSVEIK